VPICIDAADDAWSRQFERERDTLEPVLAAWLVVPIEHIGSTSVPGLPAKAIIDMMAGVGSLDEARPAEEPLTGLDYIYAEHRPDALTSTVPAQFRSMSIRVTCISPRWVARCGQSG